MIAFYGEAAGMTPEEVIAGMSIYGPASKPYGVIMPGTKYIAFAFALSEAGEVVSEVKIENFETPPADPSDNRISIRVDNVTARTADVYYTTTNSDVYLYDVVPAAEIEGMTDEQAMTHIISNWSGYINYALTSGDHLYEAEYLEPGTDYVAVGFGYDVLTYTTALTKVAFHTDEPGDPAPANSGSGSSRAAGHGSRVGRSERRDRPLLLEPLRCVGFGGRHQGPHRGVDPDQYRKRLLC